MLKPAPSEASDASMRSSLLMRKLFDILPTGIVLTDRQGHVIDCNIVAERMLGISKGMYLEHDCPGSDWQIHRPDGSRMPPEECPGMRALTDQREIRDVELEVRSPRGNIWLRVNATPFEHQDCHLLLTYADITGQKRAVASLTLAASVFEHAREGIMITDETGTILDVNAAFSLITGYSHAEAVGRNPRILRSGHHDRAFYADLWRTLHERGEWAGEVWNRRKNGEIFAVLQTISVIRDGNGEIYRCLSLFSDITNIKEHQRQLEHIAHYDSLTRLPNRNLLADRMRLAMAHCKRSGELLAVCLMDLDGFKPVNDNLGHNAGDAILREVARRLQEAVRADDTVARMGGDEFALLLGGFKNTETSHLLLRRLLDSVAQPFSHEHNPIRVTGSLGVTFYQGEETDADQLLRHADQAMYVAKERGKNRFHIFDTAVELRLRANQGIYKRIVTALENGQFCLYYQPKVDCRNGRIVGMEALIRWNHPTLGVRGPAEFIPIIEHDDLIIRLGEWVIAEALRQIDEWRRAGLDLTVSVNVTVRQFVQGGFGDRLLSMLSGYPPDMAERIELELVETAALEDINTVSQVIAQHHDQGIRFALDDFGTGYSSLVHLKRLTVDTLKIDQTFVHDMLDDAGDLAIVQGVIGLASAFHHHVIAEGVETTEQILILLELGCDLMQGYAFSRPMPADKVFGWVREFRPDPRWQVASDNFPTHGDFDLLLMEVAHRNWLARWLEENHDETGLPAATLEECGLHTWSQTTGQRRYGAHPGFSAMVLAHSETHRTAEALMSAWRSGDAETILQARQALASAGAILVERMHNFRQALAVWPANPSLPPQMEQET
jgi:diguanylate cyclase (GGDEF)-like protein/PAS domain S-box-containing protein